jgi:hypothetical protein
MPFEESNSLPLVPPVPVPEAPRTHSLPPDPEAPPVPLPPLLPQEKAEKANATTSRPSVLLVRVLIGTSGGLSETTDDRREPIAIHILVAKSSAQC